MPTEAGRSNNHLKGPHSELRRLLFFLFDFTDWLYPKNNVLELPAMTGPVQNCHMTIFLVKLLSMSTSPNGLKLFSVNIYNQSAQELMGARVDLENVIDR